MLKTDSKFIINKLLLNTNALKRKSKQVDNKQFFNEINHTAMNAILIDFCFLSWLQSASSVVK